MKKIKLIILLYSLLILFSCGEKSAERTLMDFGDIHPSQIQEKTIILNFNDEAIKENAFVEFAFELKDGNRPTNITFIINGEPAESNKLKFFANDFKDKNQVKIGISFPKDAEERINEGNLVLINTSDGLNDNITQGEDNINRSKGDVVAMWKARYTDPLPWWLIGLIVLVLLTGTFFAARYILTRIDMPFGPKSFQGGVLAFFDPDEPIPSIRLEKLINFNISASVKDLETGIILEPVDKIYNKKKRRFARLKNDSNHTLNVKYDDMEECISVFQDLYHNDEIVIEKTNGKKCTITYSNNKIKRS